MPSYYLGANSVIFAQFLVELRAIENLSDILRAIKEDDERAFRSLFDMFYKEMVVSARYLLKSDLLAEEAAQEAFVALWKNRENIDPSKSIRSYLKTATLNRGLNIIKSRAHHMGDGPDSLAYLDSNYRDPHQVEENRELGHAIKKAVDNLPDRCREVFVLSRYEAKSHKEISSILQISTKTVENQITKALKILREELVEYTLAVLFLLFLTIEWGNCLHQM